MLLKKPHTDREENYTMIPKEQKNTVELINLQTGGKYTVNPIQETCTCEDFQYRTKNGSCKHIEYVQNHPKIDLDLQKNPRIPSADNGRNELAAQNNGETPQNRVSPFSIMERKDEDQILAEMKGNIINEFVYSFTQGNREITGLSYAGVKQIALEMGNIHCREPVISQLNDSFVCKVKAVDVLRNLQVWGVSCQPKKMKTRWGTQNDDFAIQKAVSKAERNALRKLMPEKIIVEMVKEWQKQNGGS